MTSRLAWNFAASARSSSTFPFAISAFARWLLTSSESTCVCSSVSTADLGEYTYA